MYIIQMADLHIGAAEATEPKEEEFFTKSVEVIKKNIPENETVLICLCGDIIDSKGLGNSDSAVSIRYQEAALLIEEFVDNLKNKYKVIVKCCPGNHDATHIDTLVEFVKRVDKNCPPSKAILKTCYTFSSAGISVIFVNSCKGEQYKIGCVDYDALESELIKIGRNKKKVIVLHHTIMSMFEDDSSPIRNAAKLVSLIDKYNVIGVLHGHIHGREILTLGEKQCKIIGTGALFSRDNPNVNSQFNIIEIRNNIFLKILNCRYHADGGNEPWDIEELNHVGVKKVFANSEFSAAYEELMNTLSTFPLINNMRIEIANTYENFKKDIEELLKDDKLKIGNVEWSYPKLAEMWQAEEVPKELYFNHGTYFKAGKKKGIEYVVEALRKKPTSNRIVLPTYNMENVNQSLDDKGYLPSLVSIQFGKNDQTLIIHMHLRALEANRFLKINICEIMYLMNELKEKNVDFKYVNVIISAFRVQKKEKFNCFLKAQIDMADVAMITTWVNYENFGKLCLLLAEKRDAKETITKVDGIKNVYNAMRASNDAMCEANKKPIYNEDIIEILEELMRKYEKLDKIHKTSSIQSKGERECEQQIDTLIDRIIKKLEELKEGERI